jgi:ubiquinone/menaquinone biosynthesis C-methylase UbiE
MYKNLVESHYTHGELLNTIRNGISKLGKTTADVTIDDLGPVDEFHIGGRVATGHFLDQLDIDANHHILDAGCGLGGASRFAAYTYGCRVTGIDLTQEYVQTGNELSRWLKLDDRITLEVSNATAPPFSEQTFDRAFMLHVGMNITDKQTLAMELYRVLKPGAKIGIYDIMRMSDEDITFPVPWAPHAEGSSLSTVDEYKAALQSAGFSVISEQNRREFAVEFFAQLKATSQKASGPPPLGLHLLMGPTAPEKIKNMIDNIARNIIAPVEVIAQK